MEEYNDRVERLKYAIDQIAGSISSISGSIDRAASGISVRPVLVRTPGTH